MKSKEDFLEPYWSMIAPLGGVGNVPCKYYQKPTVLNVMDEYAEQVAIEFSKFKENHPLTKLDREQPMQTLLLMPTYKQLFEQFKKENNIK